MNYRNLILNKKNLSYEVSQYIKEQIVNGEIEIGSQLKINEISDHLGISQTPVREAIQYLVSENVLENYRNKGYFVRKHNEKDIFEIYSLRATIEGLAIRLAAQRNDEEELNALIELFEEMKEKREDPTITSISHYSTKIHEEILKMSKHEMLIDVNESISFQVEIVNSVLERKYTKDFEVSEHEELIEVLKEGDPEKAEKVMRNHIYRSYYNFIEENEGVYSKELLMFFPK
ncbi:GntR family transcriptional regulator [Pseudogracilibacillus auburnensis]|uniref:GntR family transcriptional regulator n=1 Tax=Pseudogracilibacillus auburnensis TaxID=1494959 RepID=UPI001A95919A|nr:GntR family transcriptional regulator [Pseudogracilibacillus auburnensis]MBO1002317.1 GntR family transcriptional regulator [Pseudogracilibacillus auburnensis]